MGKDPPTRKTASHSRSNGPLSSGWRTNSGPSIAIHWSDVDKGRLALLVDTITRAGGAVMFGRTQDGGALSLVVLHGESKMKEYPHTAVEAEELLQWLVDEFVSLV